MTMPSDLTTLLEKVKEAQKAAKLQMEEKIQRAKLEAELNLLTNERLQDIKITLALKEETLKKLDELHLGCQNIVEQMPIYDAKTRQNRKWNPSTVYGYGSDIAKVIGLLNGIQYSAREHKIQMLEYTGLNEALIETTLESFGTLPYYSTNYCLVVEGKPMQVLKAKNNLLLIAQALQITLDLSLITEENAARQYAVAKARAEKAMEEDRRVLEGLNLE